MTCGIAHAPVRMLAVVLRRVLGVDEAGVLRAAASRLEAGARDAHHLDVVLEAADAGIGRLADVRSQRGALLLRAFEVDQRIEQDGADIERKHVELEAETLDPLAVVGQLPRVPFAHAAAGRDQLGAAVVEHHVLDAKLGRQTQAALVGVEQLFADVHACLRACTFWNAPCPRAKTQTEVQRDGQPPRPTPRDGISGPRSQRPRASCRARSPATRRTRQAPPARARRPPSRSRSSPGRP